MTTLAGIIMRLTRRGGAARIIGTTRPE
jgi:hypothetical protein